MTGALILGFAFGFFGSIPVAGPISALVVTRGLSGRPRNGLGIALGGAVAEGIYAAIAFWGFAELLQRFPVIDVAARGVGGVILFLLGLVLLRQKSELPLSAEPTPLPWGPEPGRWRLRRGFALGFSVAALNPGLIGVWGAAATMVASTGLFIFAPEKALPLSLAACAGIFTWFGLLLHVLKRFRQRISAQTLNKFMRGLGTVFVLLGVGFLGMFIKMLAFG